MTDVREKAKTYISKIPKDGLSSLTDQKAFDALVGSAKGYETRQKQMEATNWQQTCCNDFAGQFANHVIGTNLSFLNLEDAILKGPKPYAWIQSTSAVEPKYGDVYYANSPHNHLGVSLGVVGGRLYKVEAGQGGALQKPPQDLIKFTDSLWDPGTIVGWVDIDVWANGPGRGPAGADAIVGDWTVWGAARKYKWTYRFNKEGGVRWRDVFDNSQTGAGSYSFQGHQLVIRWNSGSDDIWYLPVNEGRMVGFENMKSEGRIGIEASKN